MNNAKLLKLNNNSICIVVEKISAIEQLAVAPQAAGVTPSRCAIYLVGSESPLWVPESYDEVIKALENNNG